MSSEAKPVSFESAAAFRRWLQGNHAKVDVLWIRFWKKASGRGGLTYDEAVEQSLCYGWIDGLKKGSARTAVLIPACVEGKRL